jgi:hypothetical protein
MTEAFDFQLEGNKCLRPSCLVIDGSPVGTSREYSWRLISWLRQEAMIEKGCRTVARLRMGNEEPVFLFDHRGAAWPRRQWVSRLAR